VAQASAADHTLPAGRAPDYTLPTRREADTHPLPARRELDYTLRETDCEVRPPTRNRQWFIKLQHYQKPSLRSSPRLWEGASRKKRTSRAKR